MSKETQNKELSKDKALHIADVSKFKASDREVLKHIFFTKTDLYWARKRDGYRFNNEECGLAIDHYIETNT